MAAPSGSFRAGKTSRAQCNAQDMTMASWTATYDGMDLDVTNFESAGFEEGIIGVKSLQWTVSGRWNASQNPNADPPGLFPTDAGLNLKLYVSTNDNTAYLMPVFRCFKGTAKTSAKDAVDFEADGHSQGTFSVPSAQN